MRRVPYFYATPHALADRHIDFCRNVARGNTPTFVSNRPASGARAGMCFTNVEQLRQREGGRLITGWMIWEWPETLLEAEHHAVWSKDGELLDVTPHSLPVTRILFLPDTARPFDFEHRRRLDNIRRPLRRDRDLAEYLSLSERRFAIEEANSQGREVVLGAAAAVEMMAIEARLGSLRDRLATWSIRHTKRNAPCWCGSTRKVKHCCQPLTGEAALAVLS